ncbi:MAG: isoprenylcysteine carboxylmethyltransferase family protein [Anaerolineae bacterium]|nr:isoprenylcysteine carboxylmethyltransferase family protein [Anaerolineae bacterium]
MAKSSAEIARSVAWWGVKNLITAGVFALALFLPARDPRWGMGWAYLSIYIANQILLALLLPAELLAERSKPQEGSKRWDIALAAAAAILAPLAIYLVAGWDHGSGWSQGLPVIVQVGALVVMIGGIALADWAMLANPFFSGVIRIQEDRGHTVATRGPYRLMRHPGYAGGILHHLTAPLMLGSWWALIPGVIGALLFIIRTALEDRTLQCELPGYANYAQQVRFRLMPGLW